MRLSAVTSCLLLSVGMTTAQQAVLSQRVLPQWLTGLIAVSVFLFLAFISLLVKKAWCEEPSRRKRSEDSETHIEVTSDKENIYDTSLDMFRSSENDAAYENVEMDRTDRVTSM